jgi:adenylate kinase
MVGLIKERLSKSDCTNGFVLDCPYNEAQAKVIDLDKKTVVDFAINIDVPEEVAILRLSSRRVCGGCGKIYNLRTKEILPKIEGVCDVCGWPLVQREDDKEEIIRIRFVEYGKRAGPMLRYYADSGKLRTIKWDRADVPPGENDVPIELMFEKILKALDI